MIETGGSLSFFFYNTQRAQRVQDAHALTTQNAEDETTGHEITLAHMAHTVSGGKISIGASSEGRPDVIPEATARRSEGDTAPQIGIGVERIVYIFPSTNGVGVSIPVGGCIGAQISSTRRHHPPPEVGNRSRVDLCVKPL